MLVKLEEIPINELSIYKDKTILCEAELIDVVFYPNGLLKRTSFNMPSSSKYYKIAQPKSAKEPFRQHWSIVDDGGHGVEMRRIVAEDLGTYNSHYYMIFDILSSLFDSSDIAYNPKQKIGHETDFSIVDVTGSMYKAFWKGKADE